MVRLDKTDNINDFWNCTAEIVTASGIQKLRIFLN